MEVKVTVLVEENGVQTRAIAGEKGAYIVATDTGYMGGTIGGFSYMDCAVFYENLMRQAKSIRKSLPFSKRFGLRWAARKGTSDRNE